MGGSDKSRLMCVVCVCGQLSGKQHQIRCISQGSAATQFGRGGEFLQFSYVKFRKDSAHRKLLESVHFLPSYSKYKGGGECRFLGHSVCSNLLRSEAARTPKQFLLAADRSFPCLLRYWFCRNISIAAGHTQPIRQRSTF